MTTSSELRTTEPTFEKVTPTAFTTPSDTTNLPPPRLMVPPVNVTESTTSSVMSKVSVPPLMAISTENETAVTSPATSSRASTVRFPAPDTFSAPPFKSSPSTTTVCPEATTNSFAVPDANKFETVVAAVSSPRTKDATAPETSTVMSPVAVPPNDTSPSLSVTTNVSAAAGASEPPPPQAASGRRSNGNKPALFFLAIFFAHSAKSLARAAAEAGNSTTSTTLPAEAT